MQISYQVVGVQVECPMAIDNLDSLDNENRTHRKRVYNYIQKVLSHNFTFLSNTMPTRVHVALRTPKNEARNDLVSRSNSAQASATYVTTNALPLTVS